MNRKTRQQLSKYQREAISCSFLSNLSYLEDNIEILPTYCKSPPKLAWMSHLLDRLTFHL